MNRLPSCSLAMLAMLVGAPAHADDNFCGRRQAHPIDVAYAAATERSGGVTADLLEAQSTAWAAWDQELNRTYAQVLKLVAAPRREVLRAAQRAWLAFDGAQAAWDGALQADHGSAGTISVNEASLQRRRARVCELLGDLDTLRDE